MSPNPLVTHGTDLRHLSHESLMKMNFSNVNSLKVNVSIFLYRE